VGVYADVARHINTSVCFSLKPIYNQQKESPLMINSNSPLEYLSAFAIVFVIGAMSVVGIASYIERASRHRPQSTHSNNT